MKIKMRYVLFVYYIIVNPYRLAIKYIRTVNFWVEVSSALPYEYNLLFVKSISPDNLTKIKYSGRKFEKWSSILEFDKDSQAFEIF